MFELKEISDGVFEICCDGLDKRLLHQTCELKPVSLIEFCLSFISGFCKGFKALFYPPT